MTDTQTTSWQHIKTAPKDGRRILLASIRMVRYEYGEEERFPDYDYVVSGLFRKHGAGTEQKNFEEGFYTDWTIGEKLISPTHWKKLPDVPR